MSRSHVTAVAIVVLLVSVVAVWGVGAGRDAATATAGPAVTPAASPPAVAESPTATEPSRPGTLPATGTAPPPDYDGDGVPDDRDACPTRPETVNGFQDGDGCPDVVATTGAS